MNERLAKAGDQVKIAFVKVGDTWKALEPRRKKLILFIGIGLIALVLGLVIVLNVRAGRYVVLYESMGQDESVQAKGILEAATIPSRINNDGKLEVPSKNINAAMGQLAMQGIPSTTLDYNIFAEASGLTTTEFEKRQAAKHQWQNRLQDIIKTMDGVQNAFVNLELPESTDRVWDRNATKGSGAVIVHMMPGYVLGMDQAFGLRFMIGSSVGIDPVEVTVMDGDMNVIAAAGAEYDIQANATKTFLERLDLAREVELRLEDKARDILSMLYDDANRVRVNATANLNFDSMVEEIKEYFPLEGTSHGVIDEDEVSAILAARDLSQGVVGETDNTDVPVYVDETGDDDADYADYNRFIDYAVSYSLQQIEKNGPSVESVSINVTVNDSLGNDVVQSLREAIATATNLPLENVGVNSFNIMTGGDEEPGDTGATILGIPVLYFYIAIAVLVALILILVLVLVLRNRAKKKKLAAELAAAEEEQAEADRIQQEIEERKKQLKDAASGETAENAITNEVREFARNNPEITANLLRNWLKEGE